MMLIPKMQYPLLHTLLNHGNICIIGSHRASHPFHFHPIPFIFIPSFILICVCGHCSSYIPLNPIISDIFVQQFCNCASHVIKLIKLRYIFITIIYLIAKSLFFLFNNYVSEFLQSKT